MEGKARKTGRPARISGEKSTREKIFDAAVELFAQRGFDGVSIRDISQSVGITEGAVYRHYSSKDAILDAIFAYVEARIYQKPPEGSLDALADACSLREVLEGMPESMITDPQVTRITRIMLIEMYHNKKIRDYVQRELFERPVDETEVLFRKLLERGKMRPCDPRAMATQFIAYLIYWYFEAFIFSDGKPQEVESYKGAALAQVRSFAEMLEPGRV